MATILINGCSNFDHYQTGPRFCTQENCVQNFVKSIEAFGCCHVHTHTKTNIFLSSKS